MPNWQPNWENVRWDWGAADEASGALRRAADKLDASVAERTSVAREAQAEWRGGYRDKFDVDLDHMVRRARDLANQYRQAAGRIASASRRAYEEQRHREHERERWHREEEDEERRRKAKEEENR